MFATLIAVLCGFMLDVVWGRAIIAVQERKAVLAANLSVMIYLCGVFATVLVVQKAVVACCAYALGGWLGTYLVVRRKRGLG